MSINVIDELVPKNAGLFPIVRDSNFLGGFRAVANLAERDAIPLPRRKLGMFALQADTHDLWELTQVNPMIWVLWSGGGGGSPQHFQHTILWSDVAGGEVALGSVSAGYMVSFVMLEVIDAFNGATQVTIGSDLAHGELMVAAENDLAMVARYTTDAFVPYAADTAIKAFFPAGSPTAGEALITVLVA